MEILREIPQCRLCCTYGFHEADILDANPDKLCEKILTCLRIRVQRTDKSTKVCVNCVHNVNGYFRFYQVCCAADIQMATPQSTVVTNTASAQSMSELPLLESEMINPEPMNLDSESVVRSILNRVSFRSAANTSDECAAIEASSMEGVMETNQPSNHDSPDCAVKVGCESRLRDISTTNNLTIAHISLTDDETKPDEGKVNAKTQHKKRHNGNKNQMQRKTENTEFKIKCDKCTELFESHEAVAFHSMGFHESRTKKSFSCHLCSTKSFIKKRELLHHVKRKHLGSGLFKCTFPACSKSYGRNQYLVMHINAVHTREIVYKCTQCPMRFHSKNAEYLHSRKKHGQVLITHRCILCEQILASKQALRQHMTTNHQLRFKCPVCSKDFADKDGLKRHSKREHQS